MAYMLPSPFHIAIPLIFFGGLFRFLLFGEPRWQIYLAGTAFAGVLFTIWMLLIAWAYTDPTGSHPTEASRSFWKFLTTLKPVLPTFGFFLSPIAAAVIVASLGCLVGLGIRRIWQFTFASQRV